MFCFLSFRGIKLCRFFRVFSMFAGRLTMNLGICKFYKIFWPVKGKKTSKYIRENNIWRHNWVAIKPHFMFTRENIKIFLAKFFGYDISFNEYFCLLSLCCVHRRFFMAMWQNYLNCLHAILFLKWMSYKSKLFVSSLSWIFIVFCRCTVRNFHFTKCLALYIQVFVSSKNFSCVCSNIGIIEVNHLLTEFKQACMWTNKLSLFNDFHACKL